MMKQTTLGNRETKRGRDLTDHKTFLGNSEYWKILLTFLKMKRNTSALGLIGLDARHKENKKNINNDSFLVSLI